MSKENIILNIERRISNLTSSEIDFELRSLGLYNEYKSYSLQGKRQKLIARKIYYL